MPNLTHQYKRVGTNFFFQRDVSMYNNAYLLHQKHVYLAHQDLQRRYDYTLGDGPKRNATTRQNAYKKIQDSLDLSLL